MPLENKAELAKEMDKQYKALPTDVAKHVRSMKAHMDWSEGTGLREESQMTFHRGPIPLTNNRIGDPVTIYRPMSFHIEDNDPPKQVPLITKRIRQEHEELDEHSPLKQANYGVVTEGWYGKSDRKAQRVGATLFKVKDQLTDSAEEDFTKIGDFHVTMRRDRFSHKSEASGSPSSSSNS